MKVYFRKIFRLTGELLFQPVNFWKNQKDDVRQNLFSGYYLPFVLLVALAAFAGELLRGSRFYLTFPLMAAGRKIVLFLLMYVLAVFFTGELMRSFGGVKNRKSAQKLIVFSMAPVLLVSALTSLFPFLYVINILGLYALYLFWTGVEVGLELPERKKSGYILITILANLFIYSFLNVLLSKLMAAFI
jgi:hypothetical protein